MEAGNLSGATSAGEEKSSLIVSREVLYFEFPLLRRIRLDWDDDWSGSVAVRSGVLAGVHKGK